jgi:hypothetical protein
MKLTLFLTTTITLMGACGALPTWTPRRTVATRADANGPILLEAELANPTVLNERKDGVQEASEQLEDPAILNA